MNFMGTLVSLLIALGLLNGFIYLSQPGMIFFPYAPLDATPTSAGAESAIGQRAPVGVIPTCRGRVLLGGAG